MRLTWIAGLLATILALGGREAAAQTGRLEISGILLFSQSNRPCDGCAVQLEHMGRIVETAYTNLGGDFRFERLSPGRYIIRIRIEGFEEVERNVEVGPFGFSNLSFLMLYPIPVVTDNVRSHVVDVSTFTSRYPKAALDLHRAALKNGGNGRAEEAAAQLEEAIRIAPDFYAAHLDLGILYQTSGRYGEAERAYRAARDINRSSADPLVHLSSLYIDQDKPALALAAAEEGVRRDSTSAPASFNRGLALFGLARYSEALAPLHRALDLAPQASQIRLVLAGVYLKLEDWENLRAELDRYLAENPDGGNRPDVQIMHRAWLQATGE